VLLMPNIIFHVSTPYSHRLSLRLLDVDDVVFEQRYKTLDRHEASV
jgi:hypothetical protein